MPMRICSRCLRPTKGEPVHVACQRPPAYRSILHKRMSAVYRINNIPCTECHACHSASNPITAHHIVPLERGGKDEPGNYMPLCRNCNSIRGSKVGTE